MVAVPSVKPNSNSAAAMPVAHGNVIQDSSSAATHSVSSEQCAERGELFTVPTSTVFEPYPGHEGPSCFSPIGPVFTSPDGQWTAVMEGAPPSMYYHFIYGDFKDKSIRIHDLAGNVFILFTNAVTGEKKRISIASVVAPSAIASVGSTVLDEADFDMTLSLIKWSSDGMTLWGGVWFKWSGMDMLAAPPALSFFNIDVRSWRSASFPVFGNAVSEPEEATLNADRGLVLYGETDGTSTLRLNVYDFTSGATTTIVSWNGELCADLSPDPNGPVGTSSCHEWSLQTQKLHVQWVDSSTVSWIDPVTRNKVHKQVP